MADSLPFETKKALIQKQTVFSKLTENEIHALTELFIEKNFKPNETIVTEGEPVDSIFLIVNGEADVRHVLIKDNKPDITSLAQLKAGDAIGLNETGFYSLSGVRTATVVSLSEMLTLYLSLPRFHGFALAYPHVNEVMHLNSARLFENISKNE